MSLRDDDPQLRDFVDGLRAMGLEISLKHYRYHNGREVGAAPASEDEHDASVLSNLRDYYTHFGGKR